MQVSPGEQWTERDVVRAVLLASSNNHADTLVRWAFGGVDPYVEAANAWLAEAGFTATRVDDATGLSGDNVGTAEELARLAAPRARRPGPRRNARRPDGGPARCPLRARCRRPAGRRERAGDHPELHRSGRSQLRVHDRPARRGRRCRRPDAHHRCDAPHARLRDARPGRHRRGRVGRRGVGARHGHRRGHALRARRGRVGRPCRPRRVGQPSGCHVGQRVRRGIRHRRRLLDRARRPRGRTCDGALCDGRDSPRRYIWPATSATLGRSGGSRTRRR